MRWTACSAPRPLPVVGVVISYYALETLAVIWVHPTRLETRTKESNMCASLWVSETPRRNESEGGFGHRGEIHRFLWRIIDRPILLLGRFE